jgi:hypothetical protein
VSLNGINQFYTIFIRFGSYLVCNKSVLSGFMKIGAFVSIVNELLSVFLNILPSVSFEFVVMSTEFYEMILGFANNGVMASVICLWQ